MLGYIVALVVIGLIGGAIARGAVPEHDTVGVAGTILLGVVGSFVAGFLGYALLGRDHAESALQLTGLVGLVGSILGVIAVLLIYHAIGRRRPHV